MSVTKKKPSAKKAMPAKPVPRPRKLSNILIPRPNLMAQMAGQSSAPKLPARLQKVLDKSEIADVITNFARALDRGDETLLRSLLHPEATLDLGTGIFQGSGNDYVTWIAGVFQNIKNAHHQIGNVRCTFDEDSAVVESYFTAHLRLDKPTGREDLLMRGRYLDKMERRPAGTGTWKIIHRKQVIDWVRTESVSDIFYHQNPDAIWGTRTKNDPSYHTDNFPSSTNPSKIASYRNRRYDSKSMRV